VAAVAQHRQLIPASAPDLAHAVRDIDEADVLSLSRCAISSNSRPVSRSVSEAVGSSRMSRRTRPSRLWRSRHLLGARERSSTRLERI